MADYVEYEEISVDRHNNLLIIGEGDTHYSELDPSFENNLDDVKENYGAESQLTKAFELAQNLGVPYIFLLNCRNHYDFLDLIDVIDQNDFAYIAPVNIYLSEMMYLPNNSKYKTTYISYLMHKLNAKNESVFIMTDKHASLYEDIDAFLTDMNAVENKFLRTIFPNVNRENIIFMANNLEGTNFANIYAAAALTATPINTYPQAKFPPPIFRIDKFDDIGSWAYFQNHYLSGATIENFLNELEVCNPLKIVSISRIIKMIKRDLDFSEFIGKHYSEYRRMQVERKLDKYLQSLMGYAIDDYEILSVTARKKFPATVNIYNLFSVRPINCLESIQVEIAVEVGI